jgi:hypothetical protein
VGMTQHHQNCLIQLNNINIENCEKYILEDYLRSKQRLYSCLLLVVMEKIKKRLLVGPKAAKV